jgi:HEAT repeat protein
MGRKLSMIGTAASVPALAPLLTDPDESHMARFALERIPAPAAADALRQALGNVRGDLVIGMISSLANRRDTASVKPLAALLAGDAKIAAAAASALGRIATAEAHNPYLQSQTLAAKAQHCAKACFTPAQKNNHALRSPAKATTSRTTA